MMPDPDLLPVGLNHVSATWCCMRLYGLYIAMSAALPLRIWDNTEQLYVTYHHDSVEYIVGKGRSFSRAVALT